MPVYIVLFFLLFICSIIIYRCLYSNTIENFYNNVVSFEHILDNACMAHTNSELDQYENGDCVVSSCPLETCFQQNGEQVTNRQDLQNGQCVSKQVVLPQLYTHCNSVESDTSLTPTFSPSPSPSHTPSSPSSHTPSSPSSHTPSSPSHTPSSSSSHTPPSSSSHTPSSSSPTHSTILISIGDSSVSSTQSSEPSVLLTNYAEYKNCSDDEYWNMPNDKCESCNSGEVLKYRRSTTHATACEPDVDCSTQRVKCYVSPSCDVEYKEKTKNDTDNTCVLPPDCATYCRRTNVCRLDPRRPCVHPEDGSYERYHYNEDCVLTNVDASKTIKSCEKCRAHIDEETGETVRRRLQRVDGNIKCVEL
jgi:hypothetical protein